MKHGLALASIAASLLMANTAQAACKGSNCICKPSELKFETPQLAKNADGKFPISLEADSVEAQGQDLVLLEGDAEVQQGRQTIVADKLRYYRESERVVADGNVEMISENGDYLASDSIDVHVPTQIGSMTNAQFKLSKGLTSKDGVDTAQIESRGTADLVNLEGEGVVRLENAKYTTCAEGDDSVVIGARDLELDRVAGVGKARGATVRFQGIPIFYTPYISFPLNDERKTGLLTPGFGSDADSGNIFELPWYWNIAKNQDATITPRYYSDRGVQVGLEYRLQTQRSSTYIYGENMSGDEFYRSEVEARNILAGTPDAEIDDDRSLLTIQHSQQFTDSLSGQINYNDVSDIDYFDDLRNDIRYFSATYVPRDVQLNYSGKYVRIGARASEYQIIDDRISEQFKPYERLPSIGMRTNLPEGPMGMRYGLDASYTNFSSDSRIEGTRTSLNPYVELPLDNIWGYVKPRVSLYSRSYQLDNVDAGVEDNPSFAVPIFSIDSGVVFERNTSWFGDAALQTLEPRLYYVYAPEEDQSDIPLFDTSQVSLNNFSNIFRENRFYGDDRVGDTNQVTVGVTTRMLDNESGDQRLTASVGQLVILDDLEQGLSSTSATIESGLGDLLAEVRTESAGAWSTYTFLQYDHDESELRTARFAVSYQPDDDDRKNVSVGYYRSDFGTQVVDQVTVSANWPISDRWQFFGEERYSVEDEESLATTVGLEYNACCWKLRFIGTDRIHNRDIEDKRTSVFVELELTSLGRVRTGL
ncbi:LPS-assembly protein LptD [Arenicella xantha]|uniref:LPS-assembly protein LptD n=1 Tax=Arenicella xantha TaxID=644221 RepID=A0A395JJE6_9GAMM|nr:LPS-assembly protein LptD [Arenicella xantha]RBP50913.1 LPS-assembly protein [Arenicella xantha]